MSDLDIYKRQGFAGTVGIGSQPALVIVDFVEGFVDPEYFGGGNIQDAADATVPLLAAFRDRGWPVAHTRVVYAEDGTDAGAFANKCPSLLKLTENAPLGQILPSLTPQEDELVVRKRQASGFFETGLLSWLTWRGVDTLVVAGCTTSGCVRATVVDSVSHNLRTIVVSDCVGDRAMAPHEASLFDISQKYADLMTRDKFLAATDQLAQPRREP